MTIVSRLFDKRLSIHKPLRIFFRHWHKEAVNVTWARPDHGWTKLNYDGSCKCKTGESSIGGIFRDHNTCFLLGYAESIGQSNNSLAELTALMRGLEIVLENGWSDVWLVGDSKGIVDIITRKKRVIRCAQVRAHVARVNLMVSEIKNCVFTHTFREGNRAADKFAQMGHKLKRPQVWRHVPLNEVLRIVNGDAEGKTFEYAR
ncbi:polynucleotidyl transferase [Striga asiatica]|uniref:Polynucleotidyl transferase n=1 Tax=Striga asiatica TaxID=4170 RepID=A0A5A7R6G0_STRAF|nr:polynucleotidyl transferase [Striga asiatica]